MKCLKKERNQSSKDFQVTPDDPTERRTTRSEVYYVIG